MLKGIAVFLLEIPVRVRVALKSTFANRPARYEYHGYTIDNVYQAVSDGLRAEIVDMWLNNKIIPSRGMALRRVDQVFLSIRNPAGQLAGVATVYVDDFQQRGDSYYFFRMFIQPHDRIPGLMRFSAVLTRDLLRARHKPGGPQGIVHVNENQKLMRPGMRRMFERNGYEYMGRTPKGNDVWRALF